MIHDSPIAFTLLLTRPSSQGMLDAAALDAAFKQVCPKVLSVTVTHHTEPHAVYVHCSSQLTAEEQASIANALAAYRSVYTPAGGV